LRTRKLPTWDKNHRYALRFRELNRTPNATYVTYQKALEHAEPEICANAMICLTNIGTYLLHKQLITLEKQFLKEGGLRERMTKARIESRKKGNNDV
jgi:four helix bundle suffix protein